MPEDTTTLHTLPIHIWVGKAGLTDTVIAEIRKQLKSRALVKIKMLQSARQGENKEEIALRISRGAQCSIVQQRGNTLIVKRSGGSGGDTS